MATILLRNVSGATLTYDQLDENFRQETLAQSGNYTTLESDNRTTIEYTGTGGHVITLPDASTIVAAADTGDYQVTVKNNGTGACVVALDTGDTADGASSKFNLGVGASITLKAGSVADDWMVVNDFALHDTRNLAINPKFEIWQSGTSFTSVTTSQKICDGWNWFSGMSDTVTIQRTEDSPTFAQAGVYSKYCLEVDVTVGDNAVANADYAYLAYRAEGYDVAHLGFGIANTNYVTVSFWVKSSIVGLYSCALRNVLFDRTYVKEFTTTGTGWEYVALTFPVDTTGTWEKSTSIGMEVIISLAGGSDWSQAPNAWSGTNDFITNSGAHANALSADTNSFRLTLFKIEAGSVATPFTCRSFVEELLQCYRQYQIVSVADTVYYGANASRRFIAPYVVPMRDTPSGTLSLSTDTGGALSINGYMDTAVELAYSTGSAGTFVKRGTITLDARL